MSIRKNLLPVSSLLLSCLLFGSSIILAKLTFGRVTFAHVVLWRFVFASLFLLPGVLISQTRLQTQDIGRFFLVGLLTLPVTYLVQFAGFAHTTATNASLILGLAPCVYAVAAFLINKEVLRPSGWLVAALFALGAGVIAGQPSQAGHWVGDGLVLLSLLTSVVSVMLNQRLLERYPPLVATAYVFWFGLLTLLPVVLWLDGAPPLQLPIIVWVSLLMQGAVCTAVAYCLWNFGVSRLQASHVGVYGNLEPVVGALLGVMVLKEAFSLWSIMGGSLVLGAAIFIALIPSVQSISCDLATIGAFPVEVKYTSRGPRLIEINARVGGGQNYRINQLVWVDAVEQSLMACLGLPIRPPQPLRYVAECDVPCPASGVIVRADFVDEIAHDLRVLYCKASVKAGQQVVGPDDGVPDWLGEVLVAGDTIEAASRALDELMGRVVLPIQQEYQPGLLFAHDLRL